MKTIILIFILVSSFSYGNTPIHRPIPHDVTYYEIIKIHPEINRKQAQIISKHIVIASKKYNLDKHLLVSIFAQESMFDNSVRNCNTGIDKDNNPKKVCFDFGISQINYLTAKAFKFDLSKIRKDIGYAIECGALVLKNIKNRYAKKEPKDWWTRYNSNSKYWRKHYNKLVCRFYKGKETCKNLK